MEQSAMLAPAAVLIAWTMVMAVWLNVDRMRGLSRANIKPEDFKTGARGSDLAEIAPQMRDWPAHNYNHLLEQPTVFYAASVILALTGATVIDTRLAWAYVVLRILHSLWQATINTLRMCSTLFSISSLVMIALAIRALLATLGA